MGQVHDILEAKGKKAALEAELDRREVEAAATYMTDEDSGIGFLYSGWCQAALPHRKLPDERDVWQIQGERIAMVVEPGMRPSLTGPPVPIGVPYGSRARLIMLYLQSEALRTSSREVELGKSLRDWLSRLGIPQGGKSISGVRDQAERISRCRLSFQVSAGSRTGLINQNIVESAIFLDTDTTIQGCLFVETAKLSEGFYDQLKRHPVPLEEAAIRAVNNNSMALDAYAWLAYRLHALSSARPISWSSLKAQFGNGFVQLRDFKATFLGNLRLAMAVYPAANVEVTEAGLVLHPSRPPVAAKLSARG
jgi:Plasmid encoded RepA protein